MGPRQHPSVQKPSPLPMSDDEEEREGDRHDPAPNVPRAAGPALPKEKPSKGKAPKEIDPDLELTQSMRPSSGPLLRGVLLNGALALVLLGGPFVRGMLRAEASVASYGRFAACMTGGTPVDGGGLALPEGDREAFARMLRAGDPTWPSRCLSDLDPIPGDDAMFLLPGPKEHEADVRSMVTLLRGQIEQLESSPDGDVPIEVLLALGRLQGALTELVDSASARVEPGALAIALPAAEGSSERVVASRLPVTLPPGGSAELRFTPEGIDIVAADPRRFVVLRVRGATVHEEHERRASAARAVWVGDDATGYLLFTTREEVCEASEGGCSRRLTGLTISDGTAVTERGPERWIGGHLHGRADRSVRIAGTRVFLFARAAEGTELRAFDWSLPEPVEVADEEDAVEGERPAEAVATEAAEAPEVVPRHRARVQLTLGTPRDALLTHDEALWVEGTTLHRVALPQAVEGAVLEPTTVPLALTARRLHACGPEGRFVVASTPEGLQVVASGAPLPLIELAIRAPLEAASDAEEPIQIGCDATTLLIGVIQPGPTAALLVCDATACRTASTGERPVHGLDVAIADGAAWVAEWGAAGSHQVVVRRARVGPIGGMAFEAVPPLPACWTNGEGFCAPAAFATDGTHLALVTHERTDALVLAVEDGELRGLPGLR